MIGPNRSQTCNEIAAHSCCSRVIDLDPDRPDLLRVSCHAINRRADVIALDDRAVGVYDGDLGSVGKAFFAVTAGAGDYVALGSGWTANAVIVYADPVSGGALHVQAAYNEVADDDIVIGRASDR
jgi:hypothetical protein